MLFGGGEPQPAAAWPAGRMKRAVASITFSTRADGAPACERSESLNEPVVMVGGFDLFHA
jgi:hypothetical protein